jgi:hypothetical protein
MILQLRPQGVPPLRDARRHFGNLELGTWNFFFQTVPKSSTIRLAPDPFAIGNYSPSPESVSIREIRG